MQKKCLLAILAMLTLGGCIVIAGGEAEDAAAETILKAFYGGDRDTLKANSNPNYTDQIIDELIQTGARSREVFGNFVKLHRTRCEEKSPQIKLQIMEMEFDTGIYYGSIFLTADNKLSGLSFMPIWNSDSPLPQLSQEELLQDFDFMVETLRKIMPHTAVIREVYGIDVWKNLAEYRNKISEKTTLAEFCGLAVRALTSCNGHHLFPSDGSALKNSVLRERYKDILSDEDIQAGNNMAMILMTSLDVFKRLNVYNLPLQKRDGQYYTAAEIVGFGETIPKSSTLLTVNGIPAAEAESQEAFSQENRFKLSFLQVPLSQSGVEELQFKTPDERLVTITVDSTRSDFSRNLLLPGKTIPKMVQYWPELETIYVRIPRMTPADIDWYLEEINRVLDGKTAQTAIIDIRYNPGGSDAVGTQVASKLSAKEIQCNLAFAFKTDPSIVDYVTQSGISLEETELKTIDFLDNEPYYVITSESVIPGQGSAESLYILTDEIYSAAGTLTMIAGENDHMHTLGLKTEKLLGGGIDPYLFQLPNSKLFISVEPIIDITNCRTATDVMHNQVDIPLELSEEAWGQYLVTPVPADNPEALKHYLIEKDPFVQEALRQAGKLTQETIQ